MPYLTRENTDDESISCKIMTAALDLFVENGYHNVSIHDVQKRAGVSIGSIYNHFGGKEGVAKGLYEHLIKEFEEVVEDVVNNVEGPQQQCREIIARLFGFTESHRNIMAFVFNARHREILADSPSICSSSPFERMRDIVVAAMECGEFHQTNPWVAASTVFGAPIRMIQLRLDGLIDEPLPKLLEPLLDAVWNGMEADSLPLPTSASAAVG